MISDHNLSHTDYGTAISCVSIMGETKQSFLWLTAYDTQNWLKLTVNAHAVTPISLSFFSALAFFLCIGWYYGWETGEGNGL